MNSKIAMFVSLSMMLGAIMLWSLSTPAGQPVAAEPVYVPAVIEGESTLARLAREANDLAVDDAIRSVHANNKLDLDIRLVGATSLQVAAK